MVAYCPLPCASPFVVVSSVVFAAAIGVVSAAAAFVLAAAAFVGLL